MQSINEKQAIIAEDFADMGDDFGRYSYLVELSGQLPLMEESDKTDDNLVKGCQSNVWLTTRIKDGCFYFEADSDTLIIKGILYLLRYVLWGQPVSDVAGVTLDFLQKANIMVTFGADRQKGIGYITALLRERAEKAL